MGREMLDLQIQDGEGVGDGRFLAYNVVASWLL